MNDSAKREVFLLLFIPQTTVLVSFFLIAPG